MASQNDPFYVGGSVELLQSSGETPTVYFVGGSVYIVHEYEAESGTVHNIEGVSGARIEGKNAVIV